MPSELCLETVARFPEKLDFLFQPARYKVAHGGRGSAKSWSFARALLLQAAQEPLRIVCAREIQRSIKDSVHQLLCDQIQELGLGWFYEILDTEIRGKNGSTFTFSGLQNHTVESIKSFEGADRCWIEEAQTIKKRSLQILTPTIRKSGSEIWASMNPELDTDPAYQMLVLEPPDGAIVRQVNWEDNPWFTEELEAERQLTLRAFPEDYDNIWGGKPRAAVAGAIYAKEITKLQEEGRRCNVPYDPMLKVHVVCDLGFNDAMAIGLVQRHASEVRVIDYLEDTHRTLDSYSAELKDKRLNWGHMWLPHDAKHKTLAADGLSTKQKMERLGWSVRLVPDVGIEEGIRTARMVLGRTYVDKTKGERLLECLKRYRRNIPQATGEPSTPVHDEYSHGADMYRYLSIVAEQMKNENQAMEPMKYKSLGIA